MNYALIHYETVLVIGILDVLCLFEYCFNLQMGSCLLYSLDGIQSVCSILVENLSHKRHSNFIFKKKMKDYNSIT